MKYLTRALMMVLLLGLMPAASFASFGVKVNGVDSGQAIGVNYTGPSGTSITNTYGFVNIPTASSNLADAGTANGGGTSMTSTTLAVPVGYAYVKKAVTSDPLFAAGTLANGTPGQIETLYITQNLGSGTAAYTVMPTTSFGWTSIAFNQPGQYVTWLYLNNTQGWVIIAIGNVSLNNGGGTTLPTVTDLNGV